MIRQSLLAAGLLAAAALPAAADPAGSWNTPKARVKISDCGGGLCATIVSLKAPNDENGKPKVDKNNSEASKRDRPIVGISILSGMKKSGDQWRGQIYNPEDGRTYKAYMTEEGDKLNVQGCALGGLACKSQTWTRVN